MNTYPRQYLQCRRLPGAGIAESRMIYLQAPNTAPNDGSDSTPYVRRFELDPRATRERQDAQLDFLHDHHIDRNRWNMGRLLGIDSGSRIAKEGRMQETERNIDSLTIGNEGRIRSLLMTTAPKELKDAFNERLNNEVVSISVKAQNNNVDTSVDMKVDFSKPFWHSRVTEADVVRMLLNQEYNWLINKTGINFPLGLISSHNYSFTDEQAKAAAKMIMGVRYSRGVFATGGVGEVNVSLARLLVKKNPGLVNKLAAENSNHDDEKTLRAKQSLSDLLDRLEAIKGENNNESFQSINDKLLAIETDLGQLRTSPHFISPLLADTWNLVDGAAYVNLAANLQKEVRTELNAERTRLQKAAKYYRSLKDLLVAMRNQITDIKDFTVPAGGAFGILFNPAGGWIADGNLGDNSNPVEITRALRQRFELKKPQEYNEEIIQAKKNSKEHKNQNPVGAKAVIEVFKEHLKQENQLSDDEAGIEAFQAFFQNEITEQENRQLEEQIDSVLGGEHTITGGITAGALSTAKSVATGSDESFIMKIAESPEVQVPRSVGTASTTLRHKTLEATTWTGAAAATGAGLSSYGVLGSSIAVPALSPAVAAGVGYGLPILGAVGAGALGMYGGVKCFQNMLRAKGKNEFTTGLKKIGWGLGSAGSLAAGGLSAMGIELTGLAGYTTSAITVPALNIGGLAAGLTVPAALGGVGAMALGAKCFQNMVNTKSDYFLGRWGKRMLWGGAGAVSTGAGALTTAAAAGLTGLAGFTIPSIAIPAWGVGIATGLSGAVAALPVIPMAAAAAGAGLAGWGILKATGLDRRLFGTRTLGYLWPRWGARPAWGKIAHDRRKLKIVWDSMIKGVKEGKLSSTWYVRDQMREVGRLLLQQFASEMGEDAGRSKISAEDWQKFTMDNTRAELQERISNMAHLGIGAKDPDVKKASDKTAKYAAEKKGGMRRWTWNAFGEKGAITNWMNKKS